jgi:two-component system cell cycle sensor histidine kinase/response regulator CckA
LDRGAACFFGGEKVKEEVINLQEKCLKLQKELDEARKETEYYKQIALESGRKRLREIERLSNVIAERDAAEKESLRLDAEYQKAKKIEAIGMLAGGVAHDLNNVLGGIVGYPDIILAQVPSDSPARRYIIAMKESGRKAAAIVKDMLTLARKGIEPKDVINLNAVIAGYLRSPEHEKLLESHPGVLVKTDLSNELLPVMGSSHHLSKIIMNLVSNSAEAMPEDGTVWISTRNQHVERLSTIFGDLPRGSYAVVEVEDTGVGIPEEDLERIFEPFYTKKIMGRNGTGLGMAVVWSAVRDHNGYIDVKSVPGEGSVFRLFFPITQREFRDHDTESSTDDYRGRGEKVLIVDDVKDQREIASAMLSGLGYSVAGVSSGEDAIKYIKDNPVDLVILDMIMDPGIDGLDTYKGIIEIYPGQKAIIVSGFSETDRIKEVLRLGVAGYIKKPYILEKIGEAVRDVLNKNDTDS